MLHHGYIIYDMPTKCRRENEYEDENPKRAGTINFILNVKIKTVLFLLQMFHIFLLV